MFNFAAVLTLFAVKPELLPYYKDMFVLKAVGMNAFAVICLTYFLIFLHELAHYFCSYSKGIKASIRLSRRFIFVVAETKMTGLWSKPKKRAILPLSGRHGVGRYPNPDLFIGSVVAAGTFRFRFDCQVDGVPASYRYFRSVHVLFANGRVFHFNQCNEFIEPLWKRNSVPKEHRIKK
ncbi:hypothetical protein OMP38_09020 [Cohnella ginsengisoli]|uniref:Uncharacterized protein n=1 Tax=Cohnella ginsengisoli TaxID=425004 RepID=A0A9X4KFD2_9BACL|nr:hypothetical protein [Cohnella ginsengisoli]MDG0790993.1 hypothetical protein [Cohnella ginsengisoli]